MYRTDTRRPPAGPPQQSREPQPQGGVMDAIKGYFRGMVEDREGEGWMGLLREIGDTGWEEPADAAGWPEEPAPERRRFAPHYGMRETARKLQPARMEMKAARKMRTARKMPREEEDGSFIDPEQVMKFMQYF